MNSVLTTLALKEEAKEHNQSIFVVAELLYKENRKYFEYSGTDAIIYSAPIIERLSSLACLHKGITNFIMEILTDDQHSNISTVSLPADKQWCEQIETLKENGNNIAGYIEDNSLNEGFISGDYDIDFSKFGGFTHQSDYTKINSKHKLIILRGQQLLSKKQNTKTLPPYRNKTPNISIKPYKHKCILLVGSLIRCQNIAIELEQSNLVEKIIIFTPNIVTKPDNKIYHGDVYEQKIWEEIFAKEMPDSILILSDIDKLTTQEQSAGKHLLDHHAIDAQTILTAKMAKSICHSNSKTPRIIAEMTDIRNRKFFNLIGVDEIIPSTTLIERIMAKIVHNHGLVTTWLSAILSHKNNLQIISYQVTTDDMFKGFYFNDIINTPLNGINVLGWLPEAEKERLKNNHSDYSTHIITNASSHFDTPIANGDLLFLLIKK
jgi:Trk K+ transport system NAD-binding subunit